jgi:CHAP domain
MNTPRDVVDLAMSQVGTAESGDNIIKYWDLIGRHDLQGNPWCACFVTWCMKGSGVPFPTIDTPGGYVYCPDAVTYGRAHGELVLAPRVGDIILFDWEHDAISDHTGIITGLPALNRMTTVEGNVDNKVQAMTRDFSQVLAFFRPPYGSSTPSGPIPVTQTSSEIQDAIHWLYRRHGMLDEVVTGGFIVARPDGAVDCFDNNGNPGPGAPPNFGSMAGRKMNAPIVGIASTPSGKGYWMIGEDGGIFCFGDAQYKGPILPYYKQWGIGLGTQAPIIGIRRGSSNADYIIVTDNASDTQARTYHIPSDGRYTH